MRNIDYWRYSLDNPEPEDLEEEPYIHDEYIVDNPNYLKQVNYLRDLITTYCTLSRFIEREPSCTHEELGVSAATADEPSENPRDIYQLVLNEIDRLLITVENIQHNEFVAYFKCFGISHSDYREKNMQQRLTLLREILQRYCKNRKERYDQLGYTHVIQQALYDSVVSRKQGTAGIQKIRQIIEQVERESQVEIQEAATVDKLTQLEYGFYPIISPEAFEKLREKFRITYKFGQENQAKIPDLGIKIKDRLLILEAKHIKESGGEQDKQIDELIKFISQKEEEELISQKEEKLISYVAFLDGRYFNKFRDTSSADKARKQRKYKVHRQREAIEKALQDHPNNYFVNTAGLRKLLADLLSETTGNVNSQTSWQ
jgi:hypothetical protein